MTPRLFVSCLLAAIAAGTVTGRSRRRRAAAPQPPPKPALAPYAPQVTASRDHVRPARSSGVVPAGDVDHTGGNALQRTRPALPSRQAWRTVLATVRFVSVLTFLVVWALLLRPQALGGPATWVLVSGNSMKPRLHNGDLVLTHQRPRYRRGDVIAYRIPQGEVGAGTMIIHRIVGGNGRSGFTTRGDNRSGADVWRPTDAEVAGRLVASLPRAGKLLALLQTPLVLSGTMALTAFLIVPGRRSRPEAPPSRAVASWRSPRL